MQVAPQLLAVDPPERVDAATRRRDRQSSAARPRGRRRSGSAARARARPAPRTPASRTGRPLRSSGRPTNSTLSSSDRGFGPDRRRVDVDAVGDDAVLAAEPAAAGPGGGLRDRDPRVELVELSARPEQVGDRVGHPLGRVGVEGADDRGVGGTSRRPSRAAARAARARGRRRSARRAARDASWSPRRGRRTGWRRRRWRRTPRCAPAGSGSRGAPRLGRARGGARG